MTTTPTVLFLCVHNSGRSLAARVLLDHYAQGRIRVESAGSEPGDRLNPAVVAVLGERGLDPSREFPKPLTDDHRPEADVIVDHGLRGHLPRLSRQAVPRLGAGRPGRSAGRPGPAHRRRHRHRHVRALLAELVSA